MNDTDDIIVNKFALKYDPPTFVIEYTNESIDKSRIKLIRIKSPSSQSAGNYIQYDRYYYTFTTILMLYL